MRKRYKIPLLVGLSMLALVMIFILILAHTRILENQTSYALNLFFAARGYPLKVRIGDIGGNLLGVLSVRNLQVDYSASNQETYPIVQIEELKVSYNIIELFSRRWNIELLEMYNPQITIRQSPQGKPLLPLFEVGQPLSRKGFLDFKVGDVRIIGGKIRFFSGDKKDEVDVLNLRLNLAHQGEKTQMDILQAGLYHLGSGLHVTNLNCRANLNRNRLEIEKLHLATSQSDIDLKGKINDIKKLDFSFDLDIARLDLEELNKVFGTKLSGNLRAKGTCFGDAEKFEGEMFLDGEFLERDFEGVTAQYLYKDRILTLENISGRIFKSPMHGEGLIDFNFKPEEYQLRAKVENLDINNIVPTAFHTALNGEASLFGQSLSEEGLIMDIEADLGQSKIDLYRFDELKGGFSITAEDIFFFRGFAGRYKNTRFKVAGDIEFNNSINIESEVRFDDLLDFQDQTFLGKIAGRGSANLRVFGKTSDFNVNGDFSSDSVYVYGLFGRNLDVDFKIDDYISSKNGQLDIRLSGGQAWGIPYDSIAGYLTLKGENLVIVDSARFKNEDVSASASGSYDQSGSTPMLFFDKLKLDCRGNRIELSHPAKVDIGRNLVKIETSQFSADGGALELSGKMEADSLNLEAKFNNIEISPWFHILVPQKKIEGKLTGRLLASGSLEEPEMRFEGKIEQSAFDSLSLGDIQTLLEYKDTALIVDSLVLSSPAAKYDFHGSLPIDISLKGTPTGFTDKPQNIDVRFEGKSIEILPYLISDLEYIRGDFKGDLKITGTPLEPYFEGGMRISDGTLKLDKLVDPLENLEVDMKMKGTQMDFEKIGGMVKHKLSSSDNFLRRVWHGTFSRKTRYGQVEAYGKLDVRDLRRFTYDFVFKGDALPIRYEYADLSAVVDANLEVEGASPPLVRGDIEIRELYYREPFGSSEGQLGGIGDSALWDLNLNISADGQVFVMNYDMDAELKGEVVISREKGKYTLLGELEAIRGKYFLAKTFNIEKGKMTFDNIERIDPKLDFLLYTTIYGGQRWYPGTSDTISFSEYNDIELQIGGTLLSPEVSPASGSPYSREDIIQLLAVGYVPSSDDTSGNATRFQDRLLNNLGGTIGAFGSRALENWATSSIGLETFEIRPEQRGKFSLWNPEVTVGKYFANKVYFRYTFGGALSQDKRWNLEYRLSRHFLLEASRDREDKLHLGFKLNWDY